MKMLWLSSQMNHERKGEVFKLFLGVFWGLYIGYVGII